MLREIKFFTVLLFCVGFFVLFFLNTVVFSHHFIHSAPEWWLSLWQNSGVSQNIPILFYKAENLHVGNQYLELLYSFHPCYLLFKNVPQWNQLWFAKNNEFNYLRIQFHLLSGCTLNIFPCVVHPYFKHAGNHLKPESLLGLLIMYSCFLFQQFSDQLKYYSSVTCIFSPGDAERTSMSRTSISCWLCLIYFLVHVFCWRYWTVTWMMKSIMRHPSVFPLCV